MEKYRVDVSEPAENDLRDIVRYISAELSAPITALNMMGIFQAALSGLTEMPQKCPAVTDERLAMLGYHKLLVKNYIVFFTIDEDQKLLMWREYFLPGVTGGVSYSTSTGGYN